jgi:nucleoside phosphorylase/ankyrin repeat protein
MEQEHYTVGIICALPHEAAAAVAMLDEEAGPMVEQDPNDHNSYRLGRLHHHKVVIASLPAGIVGTSSAAIVAKDMLRTFKALRFGLVVGIGGAAPIPDSEDQDIRLGDVVIGRPTGTNGGLIQLDYGKMTQSEGLIRKGSLPPPPFPLLTALARLEAAQELGECSISLHLSNMFKKRPGMRNRFGNPGTENDVLYHPEYVHPASAATCVPCDISQQISRQERESVEPMVFCGTIGSSNVVMKDAILRDRLREELGVMCFEMEAAGLINFPSLVIRGISDYSDSHKNDRWQRYAAAVAAACAKCILGYIAPVSVQREQPIVQVSGTLLQVRACCELSTDCLTSAEDPILRDIASQQLAETKRIAQEAHTRYENDQRNNCRQYFDVLPYVTHKNVNPDRVRGSCSWVFEHPQYRDWLSRQRDDLLWISADPGCGKSVLAKALVDEELPRNFSVCYFFFKDNGHQEDVSGALCCLIHQLLIQAPHLVAHAIPIWEQRKGSLKHEPDALWSLFVTAATDPQAGNVVCVLDALDECSAKGRQQVISYLSQFYAKSLEAPSRTAHLKILLTSRPYLEIENGLKTSTELPAIRLAGEEECEQIKREIDIVIQWKMNALAENLGLPQETKGIIESRALAMENRTYLWVNLLMEDLQYRLERGERFKIRDLDHLPMSVDAAYEKLLDRHTDSFRSRRDALLLLHLVVGAKRPMTVKEMDVAFNLAQESLDRTSDYDLGNDFLDRDRFTTRIRNLCGLFVTVVDDKIYLIHQTAKDFLLAQNPEIEVVSRPFGMNQVITGDNPTKNWKESVHRSTYSSLWAHVTVSCLLILDYEPKKVLPVYGDRGQIQALFKYSAIYWGDYFLDAAFPREHTMQSKALYLYNAAQDGSSLWFDFYQTHHFKGNNSQVPPTSLVVACLLGHSYPAEVLIQDLEPEDAQNSRSRLAPVFAAVRGGHKEIVQVLLRQGFIQERTGIHGLAVMIAAANGNAGIIQSLVKPREGIDNFEGGDHLYRQCFHWAVTSVPSLGFEEVITNLAADETAFSSAFEYVLEQAAMLGQEKIFWLVMNKYCDNPKFAQLKQRYLHLALQGAARNGSINLTKRLLEQGASPNAKYTRGSNTRGGNRKPPEPSPWPGLEHAGLYNPSPKEGGYLELHDNILKEAMMAYAGRRLSRNMEAIVFKLRAPLLSAVMNNCASIVSLLVDHGASINTASPVPIPELGRPNALEISLQNNFPEISALLIMNGAEVPDFQYPERREQLGPNFVSVAKNLLREGFSIEKVGRSVYEAAVRTAKRLHCKEFVAELLEKEPSLVPRDEGSRNMMNTLPPEIRRIVEQAEKQAREWELKENNARR